MATGDKIFLQKQIDENNKLSADLLASGETNVAVSNEEKTTWNGKQNEINESNKLSADLLENGETNVAVSNEDKTKWDGKQDKLTAGVGIGINDYNTIFAKFNVFIAWPYYEGCTHTTSGYEILEAYNAGKACVAMYHATSTKEGVTKDVFEMLPLAQVEYIGNAGEPVYRFNFSGITKGKSIHTAYISSNANYDTWKQTTLGVMAQAAAGNGVKITGGSNNVINVNPADATISSTADGVKVAYGSNSGLGVDENGFKVAYGDNSGLEVDEYGLRVRVSDGLTTEGEGAIRVLMDYDTMDLNFETGGLKAKYKDYYKGGTNIEIASDGTINNTYEFDYTGDCGVVVDKSGKRIYVPAGPGLMTQDDILQVMPGDTMEALEETGYALNVKCDNNTIKSDSEQAYALAVHYDSDYMTCDENGLKATNIILTDAATELKYKLELTNGVLGFVHIV